MHQATALANATFGRKLDVTLAKTNELRTTGTDTLLAAARDAGIETFVAQSGAGFGRYARQGGPVKSEGDPLERTPPSHSRETANALNHLEHAVTEFGGIALHYGAFYGADSDAIVEAVRTRRFPLIGDGAGVWSWIHVDDAAAATVHALQHRGAAIYNVVDDDPAPVSV